MKDASFLDHLKALKRRIVFLIISFIALFIICYINSGWIIKSISPKDISFVYLSPQEVLLSQLRISLVFALILQIPVTMGVVLEFLQAGAKHTLTAICLSLFCIALFVAGTYFTLTILMPFMISFLTGIGESQDYIGMISIENYISFFITLTCCIGLLCELPLIGGVLTYIGITTPSAMKKAMPVAVISSFIIGGLITPPDVVSQAMVAIPAIGIYVLTIGVSIVITRLKSKKTKKEALNEAWNN